MMEYIFLEVVLKNTYCLMGIALLLSIPTLISIFFIIDQYSIWDKSLRLFERFVEIAKNVLSKNDILLTNNILEEVKKREVLDLKSRIILRDIKKEHPEVLANIEKIITLLIRKDSYSSIIFWLKEGIPISKSTLLGEKQKNLFTLVSALSKLRIKERLDVTRSLIRYKKKAKISQKISKKFDLEIVHLFSKAISSLDKELSLVFIEEGISIQGLECREESPLCVSAATGQEDILEKIIPLASLKDLNTALLVSSRRGSLKSTKLLVKAGANLNSKDYQGNSPLHFSFMNKREKIFDFLVKEGANIYMKNADQELCVQVGVQRGISINKLSLSQQKMIKIFSNNGGFRDYFFIPSWNLDRDKKIPPPCIFSPKGTELKDVIEQVLGKSFQIKKHAIYEKKVKENFVNYLNTIYIIRHFFRNKINLDSLMELKDSHLKSFPTNITNWYAFRKICRKYTLKQIITLFSGKYEPRTGEVSRDMIKRITKNYHLISSRYGDFSTIPAFKSLTEINNFLMLQIKALREKNHHLPQEWIYPLEGVTFGDYEVTIPKDSHTLIHWGMELNNCLAKGFLLKEILSQDLTLFGLKKNGKISICISIKNGYISEAKGKANSSIKEHLLLLKIENYIRKKIL